MSGLAKLTIGLLIAFVVVASAGLLFWARPTPILGVDGKSLAHSVKDGSDTAPCTKAAGDWVCEIEGDGPPTKYAIDLRWDGCWKGDRVSGPLAAFTPEEISGCISLGDHLRLEEVLN